MEIMPKAKMAEAAEVLAQSNEMVCYMSQIYAPHNWDTGEMGPCDPELRIWLPLTTLQKRILANQQSKLLFTSDSEVRSFELMLEQFAQQWTTPVDSLLVRTEDGLRTLSSSGQLLPADGSFHPNYLTPQLVTESPYKEQVVNTFREWLVNEDDVESLLHHLATALSPGWSAVKYVLLIGDGRNGKSVLLSMLSDLFGRHNISQVSRQQMAASAPVCTELNGKLLNLIFDGSMEYVKDSGPEKTLVAGETLSVRRLYANMLTPVQTNALFIEALNSEPKSRDKSNALQRRMSRFFFPNVYEQNPEFEKHMRSPEMLGAFLAVLLDHFVEETEIKQKLKLSQTSIELQASQQLLNSPVLQFLEHLVLNDPKAINRLREGGMELESAVSSFMAWRLAEGHGDYSSADTRKLFREVFQTTRKTSREGGVYRKIPVLGKPKPAAELLLDQLEGDMKDAGISDNTETLVGD